MGSRTVTSREARRLAVALGPMHLDGHVRSGIGSPAGTLSIRVHAIGPCTRGAGLVSGERTTTSASLVRARSRTGSHRAGSDPARRRALARARSRTRGAPTARARGGWSTRRRHGGHREGRCHKGPAPAESSVDAEIGRSVRFWPVRAPTTFGSFSDHARVCARLVPDPKERLGTAHPFVVHWETSDSTPNGLVSHKILQT